MSESLENLSVIDLRKLAKEKGIKLGAGINKQGIIEKMRAALEGETEGEAASEQLSMAESTLEKTEAIPEPAPAPAPRPVYSAAIITDDESDEEDVPVLTANPRMRPLRPAPRPAAAGSAPAAPQGASTLGSISAKAPAFTLEGSQAWHNPRAYQGQSNYQHASAPAGWGRPGAGADSPGLQPPRSRRPAGQPRLRPPSCPARDLQSLRAGAAAPGNGAARRGLSSARRPKQLHAQDGLCPADGLRPAGECPLPCRQRPPGRADPAHPRHFRNIGGRRMR